MMFYVWMFIKLITGFAFIMAYLNISGRTQFSQMNSIDLIGNFILGGLVGGVLYSNDIPFYEYLVSMTIGVFILFTLNFLNRKIPLFHNVTVGRQIPIIKNGRFLMNNIIDKYNRVDMLNIASQLNLQGIFSFDEIYYAQIEPNGSVTAICDKNKLPASIICYRGAIREDELTDIKHTREELLDNMKSVGIEDPDNVFLGEFKNGRFKYILNDGTVLPPERKKKTSSSGTKKLAEKDGTSEEKQLESNDN